jgi:glycine cleavage system H protein
MSKIVEGLYYTPEHEWVRVENGVAYVGITDHAQHEMGDVVYVDCGQPDADIAKGDSVAVVESVKAASDVYTPISGKITAVNDALMDAPESLNNDPYGSFLFAVAMTDATELDGLMDAKAYADFCNE